MSGRKGPDERETRKWDASWLGGQPRPVGWPTAACSGRSLGYPALGKPGVRLPFGRGCPGVFGSGVAPRYQGLGLSSSRGCLGVAGYGAALRNSGMGLPSCRGCGWRAAASRSRSLGDSGGWRIRAGAGSGVVRCTSPGSLTGQERGGG